MIPETRILFSEIEGIKVFSALAIANDLPQFRRFMTGIAPVLTLGKLIDRGTNKWEYQGKIAHRIGDMLAERHSLEYVHPSDTALAIYLCLLHEVESPYTLGLATAMYTHGQLWWGRKMAKEIITDQQFVFPAV